MTLCIFFGILDTIHGNDLYNLGSVKGGGKTASMTYCLKHQKDEFHQPVFTNYFTDFSDKIISFREMIEFLQSLEEKEYFETYPNGIAMGIDELQAEWGTSHNSKQEDKDAEIITNQSRKRDMEIFGTMPRFRSGNNRLRAQGDILARPFKIHDDRSICPVDNCKEHHHICIFTFFPAKKITNVFDIDEIKDHYNTRQMVFNKPTNNKPLKKYKIILKLQEIQQLISDKQYDILQQKFPKEYDLFQKELPKIKT